MMVQNVANVRTERSRTKGNLTALYIEHRMFVISRWPYVQKPTQ